MNIFFNWITLGLHVLPNRGHVVSPEVENQTVSRWDIGVCHSRMVMLSPFMQTDQDFAVFHEHHGEVTFPMVPPTAKYGFIPFAAGVDVFYGDDRIEFCH